MGLESATYISDLVSTNPVHATDDVSEGDDHIRLIKSTLFATFPNIAGAVTASHSELNILDGATLTVSELNILDADNTFNLDNAIADLDGTTFTADYTTITLTGGSAVVTLSGTEVDLTATTLDFNGAASLSGLMTFERSGASGVFGAVFSSAVPGFAFNATGDSSDEKNWDFFATAGQLKFRTNNDSVSVPVTWLTVERTGTTVDEIQLDATTLDFNGNADISGTLTVNGAFTATANVTVSSTTPSLSLIETDATTDEGFWLIRASSGILTYSVRDDGGGAGSQINYLTVVRTGTNIDALHFDADLFDVDATTFDLDGNATLSGTLTLDAGKLSCDPGNSSYAPINLGTTTSAPSSPVDGDVWINSGGTLSWRMGGTTYVAATI